MALINDLLAELEIAKLVEQGLVAGGENLIDSAAGNSTLTPATQDKLRQKFTYEVEQLVLISSAITALENLVDHGYPVRNAFDVDQAIADELNGKMKQMDDFLAELQSAIVGADSGSLAVVEASKKKK